MVGIVSGLQKRMRPAVKSRASRHLPYGIKLRHLTQFIKNSSIYQVALIFDWSYARILRFLGQQENGDEPLPITFID